MNPDQTIIRDHSFSNHHCRDAVKYFWLEVEKVSTLCQTILPADEIIIIVPAWTVINFRNRHGYPGRRCDARQGEKNCSNPEGAELPVLQNCAFLYTHR